MIPKMIHYCWFGPKPYPKLVIKCIETWKRHLPEYEIFLWNESNSPMEVPFVREAYEAKKYAFVADYVRFWALYNYGGIYMDTDMFVIRSLDNLLENSCFFGWENSEQTAISCGIIATLKGDLFIGKILETYYNLHFKEENIDKLVVPRLLTAVYNENKFDYVQLYEYDYFYAFPYVDRYKASHFKNYATKNTYAIHLWNMSWVSYYEKLTSRIVSILKPIYKHRIFGYKK